MKVERNEYEPNASYNRRVWFINQMNIKTENDKKEAIKLSNIWTNMVLLHCIYSNEVMNKIGKILGNSVYKNSQNMMKR